MSITGVSIRRPVATAMFFLILIVIGVVSLRSLPVDLLPSIEFSQLTVRVQYPNVGPEEIERIITDRVENAVSGLPNLERMRSRSQEGMSWVTLEFGRGTNIDEAANDLRAVLDRLRDELPVEAGAPEVLKLDLDRIEVVSIGATSTMPLDELTQVLEDDIARRFEQIPGVGAINVRGGVYREIRIELDRDRLKATGLTALDVQQAVSQENVTLPGGNVKRGMADLYVRTAGEYQSVEEIARTVITNVNGRPVRLQDVAVIRDSHEDLRYLVEINGSPSVSLGILKQSGANTVEVADLVRAEIERINTDRDDLYLTVFADQSDFIRQSIDSVKNSAVWGSLLAILVLYLFLRNGSSTGIIALAIPISVISTFGLLYFGGLTLNQMTFGGLALGVGLIVDNSIVVLESIVRKREEEDAPQHQAAASGTRDVAGAIIASTLTTCVIFLPVVFTRSVSGAMFQALALVVVFSLACSLFVALTLVPMLAARFLKLRSDDGEKAKGFMGRVERGYAARLRGIIGHRLRVFAITGGLLVAVLFLWPLIPIELAPQTEADEIDIDIDMAQGTNIAVVRAYVEELESRVRQLVTPDEVELVSTEVRGSNAEVELKLTPRGRRSVSGTELADRLRAELEGSLPGAEIRVDAQPGLWILRRIFSSSGGEDAVELQLRDWDLDRADRIAADIRQRMEAVPGVSGVRISRREGQPEENLVIDRERLSALGLSVREVARTLQANVGGLRAGNFREGGDEFPIVVRLAPQDRLTADDLSNISLRAPGGEVVPLSAVVERRPGRGPIAITRVDGQRVTYISATLDSGVALGDAVERIQASLADVELPAETTLLFGGEYEEQQQARRDFVIAILMALMLVYMLLAGQFERFLDPLIVMLAVPMALIGVIPTLLLTGTTLNLQSVMGLIMLVGIVVNNAIVLVDAINLLRREHGLSPAEAVIEAGRLRLRPILMTTSTTVLALLPLALGIGPGAEIQASFARVVIGGLTASTLVTLALIPVAYLSATEGMERIRERVRAARARAEAPAYE
ncbi:MAG: efflux RND transporter permease subunit [Thermoanaerobaculia bacterium]